MKAPLPADETQRLEALLRYRILDTPAEDLFDDVAWLAAHVCQAPIAFVSFIDDQRQWFKARVGCDIVETPRAEAACAHTILRPDIVTVVPDATTDERFAANPLVVNPPFVRLYAAAPLVTDDGYAIGTLCVVDPVARGLTREQTLALAALARQVVRDLELRVHQRELEQRVRERTVDLVSTNARLQLLLREIDHRVKNNLQVIHSLLNLQSRQITDAAALSAFQDSMDRVRSIALIHESLSRADGANRVSAREYLERLASHLAASYGADVSTRDDGDEPGHERGPRVRVVLHIDDIPLDVETAVPCGLLVNELVTNALRHGFPGGRTGEVRVELRRDAASGHVLRVADDGVGFAGAANFAGAPSLGLQLVATLAEQLGGATDVEGPPGTSYTLRFQETRYAPRV